MAKTDFQSVDDYLASQPQAARDALERVRGAIRQALPGAAEVISYQIPAFKVEGSTVVYFAGWKEHYSLYPITEKSQTAFRDELAPYKVSKGTVRFPFTERVPIKLIERIAEFRAKEVAERVQAKAAAPKPKRSKPAAKAR